MSGPNGVRLGRLVSMALAAVALTVVFAWSLPAFADEIKIDTEATVQQGQCDFCHANIANTSNYSQEIIFSHGLHIIIACESCHSQFPHSRSGTAVPTMQTCFKCHGLRHGPMGILATGECKDCHITPRERLRPTFHTNDWQYEPHVDPGNKEFQTKCMMCHTQRDCDDCHLERGIDWKPKTPYAYDPKDGCQACHGNENLVKASSTGPKSFHITGVDKSVHRDISCIQCHADFKYDDSKSDTALWDVNAGKACMNCHPTHDDATKEYVNSIHGIELAKGNLKTATCASCHGGHDIKKLTGDGATQAARDELHQDAYGVCARCHREQYDSYDDYYHGRAYKAGNNDAPACWNCHGAHNIRNSKDPKSPMSAQNRNAACGGSEAEGMSCHEGSGENFGEAAGVLIHEKRSIRESNWLAQTIGKVKGWFGGGE